MRFRPLDILKVMFPVAAGQDDSRARAAAAERAERWRNVFLEDPRLGDDVLDLGLVLALGRYRLDQEGMPEAEPVDLYEAGRERGRRDLALELLALMATEHDTIRSKIIENMELGRHAD